MVLQSSQGQGFLPTCDALPVRRQKFIWLALGNCTRDDLLVLIQRHEQDILTFETSPESVLVYRKAAKFYSSLRRNSAHAFVTSGVLRMADTTQIRFAPAAKTSFRFFKLMPPIANHGTVTFAAAQRTYSSVTGFAVGLVPVA